MPSAVSKDELCESILDFATNGTYPDSQDLVSLDFPLSLLPEELRRISEVREQVQKEICALSNNTKLDVDGWIFQARQLHTDIERSRDIAREIVAQHERTLPLQAAVKDASAKVNLVQTELTFNQAVTDVLEKAREFCSRIDDGQKAVEEERITDAIAYVESAESFLKDAKLSGYDGLSNILHENASHLRKSIIELLRLQWASEVRINKNEMALHINNEPDQSKLYTLIESLSQLHVLESVNNFFQRDLMESIIQPIIVSHVPGEGCEVSVDNHGLKVGKAVSTSVSEVFNRLAVVLSYLQKKLPLSILEPLSQSIIPTISTTLCDSWLTPSIPLDVDHLQAFEGTLTSVKDFCGLIEGFGWHGQESLASWIDQFPRLWLTCRRVDSLDQVRKILIHSNGATKEVTRVEKQMVTSDDDVLLDSGAMDEWDADWDDENEEEPKQAATDEDDVSAWGLEDEAENEAKADDDADDAWGWGDDNEDRNPVEKEEAPLRNPHQEKSSSKPTAAKEITLTETYMVTDIPDSIITLVMRQISDSQSLSGPDFSTSRVVSSKTGLTALPTLILAMFKAIASSFYSLKLNAGNIHLYNDSMYLAEQVRNIVTEQQMARLLSDVDGLERFARLSYSKEMQTQRTIVTDLLDGSQGFIHCSEQPFLKECENAIDATVDRIRDLFKEWKGILSHSALLQAMGSLVSTVINKTIIDIEDLSDISEEESQQLLSFCNKLSKLEDMFMPEPATDGVSTAAVYVRNWLKFQYLISILESSLADIRYLWTEGELSLEFTGGEVIDLINALFAESDHRRKTISEIRRTHVGT
ncbi:Centromere/kinetochore Zw10-domain-containing protein [Talaromyces proteolyticus]|uniref:Centromere/kinetochore Zw10-domain-containing protein n=1 Tax=Talaromyces proteolyticus TaxID=1131652 RepID=A0AAD4KQX9_9EURO|nr:Centromere/kinetochore Zw10-domain-containing protein [Talaromyces proteolyticus]KAH8693632.1 Centromere/kinetochore Zw10-domain-containing protein [Talaromyces proteolyticus]